MTPSDIAQTIRDDLEKMFPTLQFEYWKTLPDMKTALHWPTIYIMDPLGSSCGSLNFTELNVIFHTGRDEPGEHTYHRWPYVDPDLLAYIYREVKLLV